MNENDANNMFLRRYWIVLVASGLILVGVGVGAYLAVARGGPEEPRKKRRRS
jgi:hypothetical protein